MKGGFIEAGGVRGQFSECGKTSETLTGTPAGRNAVLDWGGCWVGLSQQPVNLGLEGTEERSWFCLSISTPVMENLSLLSKSIWAVHPGLTRFLRQLHFRGTLPSSNGSSW